jgi:predicted GNAT family acetyltransferase
VTVLGTTHVRALGASDLPALRELLDRDPLVNVFVRHRVDVTGLEERVMGGCVWGYFEDDELLSACHAGANVVPVEATRAAVDAFAEQLLRTGVRPTSVVGPRDAATALWKRLEGRWGPARSARACQPFLTMDHDPVVPMDPRVRRVTIDEFDVLYPACVDMFTEEVGVHPETSGAAGYRARVAQLITLGWAFAIIEDGEVLFKTEVGAATEHATQLQGVWVRPDLRGRGLAVPALAAVVREVRASIAPVATLYVNDHNVAARRTYARIGFDEVGTFASFLL